MFNHFFPADSGDQETWQDAYQDVPRTIEITKDWGLEKLEDFWRSRPNFYDIVVVSRPHNMKYLNYILARENLLDSTKIIYDKFIYLVRKDTLAQAISIVLTKKTQIWHIYQNSTQTKVSKPLPQVYLKNLQKIKIDNDLLTEVKNTKDYFIKQQTSYLQNLIISYKLSPLIVEDEKILENPQEQVKTILDYLN